MRGFATALLVFLIVCCSVQADTFTERWYLAGGGIASGQNSYVDRGPGPDRLPYTADDVDLPQDGNVGGAWSFCFFDVDADDLDEHTFTLVRRSDDDMFTISSWSDFAHGVIAEGELWVDVHHAMHAGPAGIDYADDDFEWNDRPGWEGESNWFWYNNMKANQRGLGGSRYYFEYRDPVAWPELAFDEVQGWAWNLSMKNSDDGTGVGGYWGQAAGLVVRGLFIPVDAIDGLEDGELDPLFGWQEIDMATYVRDILGPKLEDPDLSLFVESEVSNSCLTTSSLPPTCLMIIQAEAQLLVNDPFKAGYWDITDGGDALFRWSSICLKGDNVDNPPITLEPSDGRYLNLWRRDSFVRDNEGDPGLLEFGAGECPDFCWTFIPEGEEDCQPDYVLRLPAMSGPDESYFMMPVGWELDGRDGAIVTRARLAFDVPDADANSVQLILADGDEPVAWASMQDGVVPSIGVGGLALADTGGIIENPVESSVSDAAIGLAAVDVDYSTVELRYAPAEKTVQLLIDGETAHTFTYSADVTSTVTSVWVRAESDAEDTGVNVDDIAVFQEYTLDEGGGPMFIRGDANSDGAINIADAISTLSYLFGGGALACRDAGDCNDDGQLNIADAITVLSYLFGGGEALPPPGPFTCGEDPTEDTPQPGGDLGCAEFTACN